MTAKATTIVIPAEAGIQLHFADSRSWTPACAGVTNDGDVAGTSPAMTGEGESSLHEA
jgi:hypothetical protein